MVPSFYRERHQETCLREAISSAVWMECETGLRALLGATEPCVTDSTVDPACHAIWSELRALCVDALGVATKPPGSPSSSASRDLHTLQRRLQSVCQRAHESLCADAFLVASSSMDLKTLSLDRVPAASLSCSTRAQAFGTAFEELSTLLRRMGGRGPGYVSPSSLRLGLRSAPSLHQLSVPRPSLRKNVSAISVRSGLASLEGTGPRASIMSIVAPGAESLASRPPVSTSRAPWNPQPTKASKVTRAMNTVTDGFGRLPSGGSTGSRSIFLSEFEVLRPITRGSVGKVFLCCKRESAQLLAMKVLFRVPQSATFSKI